MSSLIKKDAMTRASLVYNTMASSLAVFKQTIDKLRESVDQIDLTNSLFKHTFGVNYNSTLSDLVTSLRSLLETRKTTVGDNGAVVIKPVNSGLNDYKNEIWYGHTIKTDNGEKRFPPRVVCVYDNFSINQHALSAANGGFDFLINDKTYTILDSSDLGLDSPNIIVVQTVIDKLNVIVATASYIQEYCLLNKNNIDKYLIDFTKQYL